MVYISSFQSILSLVCLAEGRVGGFNVTFQQSLQIQSMSAMFTNKH